MRQDLHDASAWYFSKPVSPFLCFQMGERALPEIGARKGKYGQRLRQSRHTKSVFEQLAHPNGVADDLPPGIEEHSSIKKPATKKSRAGRGIKMDQPHMP